jgi:DnaJ-class molecular chaperone
MQEACLICQGGGRHQGPPCPYCAGTGRVPVRTQAPQTVLMATGSCKMPVRQVSLEGALVIPRLHSSS